MKFARLAFMLAALPVPAAAGAFEPDGFHDCSVERDGDYGWIAASFSLDPEGRPSTPYRLSWGAGQRLSTAPGLRLIVRWDSMRLEPPPETAATSLSFEGGRRTDRRTARIEISRAFGYSTTYRIGLSSQFERYEGGVTASLDWGALRRWGEGVAELHVFLIERGRGMVASNRIPAAALAAPEQAVAAQRGDVEALIRDFRSRCAVHVHDSMEDI